MAASPHGTQLELFDLQEGSKPVQLPRVLAPEVRLHLRYDQAVLAVISGVIGITVVFACGVERGKHLVRSERALLVRQPPDPAPASEVKDTAPKSAAPTPPDSAPATPTATEPPRRPRSAVASSPAPDSEASGAGRYAVQVVTYSRAMLAKRELDRLTATGERAFLVRRDGRTVLYVGPFRSKTNAQEKLAALKGRYQDCFVKTL
jgi:cell division septation protein DedD